MDVFQAILMGILQGLSEFLPISSSGHLILLPWAFGWQDPGLTFDIALHMGTLLAVLAYFWHDWWELLGGFVRTITGHRQPDDQQARLFWLLVVASIPGAIVGALGESAAESTLRAPALVAAVMIAGGFLLILAEAIGNRNRLLQSLGISDSVLVGLAQAIAIVPGLSRSGMTISMGLFRGFNREAAARFSFLLATPIIAGAALFNMRHLLSDGLPADERTVFLAGIASAALVGFLAIAVLLRYLQNHSLRIFAYYRFAVGAGIIVLLLVGR